MQYLSINLGIHPERTSFFCPFSDLDMLQGENYIEKAPKQLIFSLFLDVAYEPLMANEEMAQLHLKSFDEDDFFNEDMFKAILNEKYGDNDNIVYLNLSHGGLGCHGFDYIEEDLIFIFDLQKAPALKSFF